MFTHSLGRQGIGTDVGCQISFLHGQTVSAGQLKTIAISALWEWCVNERAQWEEMRAMSCHGRASGLDYRLCPGSE